MPSKSQKQHKFMAAVANNPKFAAKAGVPQSVGEEFMKADKGKKYGKKKMVAGGMTKNYAKGGSVTRADGMCRKGHTKGRMV